MQFFLCIKMWNCLANKQNCDKYANMHLKFLCNGALTIVHLRIKNKYVASCALRNEAVILFFILFFFDNKLSDMNILLQLIFLRDKNNCWEKIKWNK